MIKKNKSVFIDDRPIRFFESAEEVWFWFCFCESMPKSKTDGVNYMMRPCETSDIAIIVKRLILKKELSQEHLKILSLYGLKQISPSEKYGEPIRHCILWKEAIERLSRVFLLKGIIAPAVKAVGL